MLSTRPRITKLQVRSWYADRLHYFTYKRPLEVLKDPNLVVNFDETTAIFSPMVAWVIVCSHLKSTKHAFTDKTGQTVKGSVTALIMASVSGNFPHSC